MPKSSPDIPQRAISVSPTSYNTISTNELQEEGLTSTHLVTKSSLLLEINEYKSRQIALSRERAKIVEKSEKLRRVFTQIDNEMSKQHSDIAALRGEILVLEDFIAQNDVTSAVDAISEFIERFRIDVSELREKEQHEREALEQIKGYEKEMKVSVNDVAVELRKHKQLEDFKVAELQSTLDEIILLSDVALASGILEENNPSGENVVRSSSQQDIKGNTHEPGVSDIKDSVPML